VHNHSRCGSYCMGSPYNTAWKLSSVDGTHQMSIWTGPKNTVTDLIDALPGNSSLNTVQHATIEEAMFSRDPIDATINWLDSDHMICVCCRSMFSPWLYKLSDRICSGQL
jgi:hypothetical protein